MVSVSEDSLALSGHHLISVPMSLTALRCSSILLPNSYSSASITIRLSIAGMIGDHILGMENYVQQNHLMEITNVGHVRIKLVTV
jgi:hypothetical protein